MDGNFAGKMDTRSSEMKTNTPTRVRMFSASVKSVIWLEVFIFFAFVNYVLYKIVIQMFSQPEDVLTAAWSSIIVYLKFMASYPHSLLLVSLVSITYIHGMNATVVKKVPTQRYLMVSQFFESQTYACMAFIGIGCVTFVGAAFHIFEVSIAFRGKCKQLTDISPKYDGMTCSNEKNLFITVLVFVLVVAEYVKWKTDGGYVLKFYHLQKRLKYHVTIHLWTNRMLPLKRFLFAFPIGLIVYKYVIQTPLLYIIQNTSNTVFQDGIMTTWADALEVEFVIKCLVASYLGLTIFHCQWIAVNYALVQRENLVIHSMFPDSLVFMHRHFICADDPYIQTLGWYDITRVNQKSCERLMQLFVLSHPGNRPTIWKLTVDQCIRVGTEWLKTCLSFIGAHNVHTEAISGQLLSGTVRTHGGGLTMYSPSVSSAPDLMRQRHMIGRDLSSNLPSHSPEIAVSGGTVQLRFWETIYLGPIILWKILMDYVKTRFGNVISVFKRRNLWVYWMESDFELEFNNVLADSFIMMYAIHAIVDAIGVAISNNSRNIIQRDVYQINQFFIDIYEAMNKLGGLIPKKMSNKCNENGELVEIYSDLKAEHRRIQNELKYEVSKYFESVAPYFDNVQRDSKMCKQMLKIIDEEELDLDD